MTASEFAFLALGLVLGIASGAALVEVLRARPPAAREIRITVAPNSIHARRAATLAEDAFPNGAAGPAAGGPGDRRWNDSDPATADLDAPSRRVDDRPGGTAPTSELERSTRTPVQSGQAGGPSLSMAASGPPEPFLGAPRPALMWLTPAIAGASRMVAVPMSLEPDPITHALRATAARVAVAAMGGASRRGGAAHEQQQETASAGLVARAEVAAATGRPDSEATPTGSASPASSSTATEPAASGKGPSGAGGPPDAGPCAEERRTAEERCTVASRAREGSAGAAEALRVAQRAYDAHIGNAESAAAATDPRSVRTAKEAAQKRFRDARAKATTRDHVEAAARAWLSEINEINGDTREAAVRIERDRAAAAALAPVLERLAVEADAARISAERADEACMAAREAVAACDEARTLQAAAVAATPRKAAGEDRIAAILAEPEDELEPMGSRAGEDAVLIRILRGDREAMLAAVARLGGDDADARRRWQTWLSALAEALIARSIEASAFDFPLDHYFWGPFSQTTNRDIAAALSSIGYRFDGFGGWADERVPSQRDLSMAVGYAGEDPMRIRRWPTEAEMQDLFQDVRVAADEYVASAAGGLTLGELVTLLGRRADALTELWNEWGIVRPILLEAI